jgi:hypothetical protein
METSKGVQDVINHTLAQAGREKEMKQGQEFQTKSQEYFLKLQQEAQLETGRITAQVKAQQEGMTRYIAEWERQKAVVPAVNDVVRDQVHELSKNGYWDRIPNGRAVRSNILRSLRHSEAFNESHYSAPYLEQAVGLYNQAVDDILSGHDPDDLTGMAPQPMLVRLPDMGPEALGVKLPVFSEDQLRAVQLREGYPAGGSMLDATDPTREFATPWSYQTAMQAIADEHIMKDFSFAEARQQYVEGRIRTALEAEAALRTQEEVEKTFTKIYKPLGRDSVLEGMQDVVLNYKNLGGQPIEKAVTDSILQSMFRDSPELANRAMSLLDEENPWNPTSPGELRELLAIRAGVAAASDYLETTLDGTTGKDGKPISADIEFMMEVLEQENQGAAFALGGVGTAGDKAVAFKRAMWRVNSGVSRNLAQILTEVDDAAPSKAFQEEFRGADQLLDRFVHEYASTKDEVVRQKLMGDLREGVTSEVDVMTPEALDQAVGEPSARFKEASQLVQGLRYRRPVGPLEATGLLFHDPANPAKMAPFLDLVSGGKAEVRSPNVPLYHEATKTAPDTPARKRRRDRELQRQEFHKQRTQPTPPATAPPPVGAGYGAAGQVARGATAAGRGVAAGAQAVGEAAGSAVDAVGGALEPIGEALIGEKGLNTIAGGMNAMRPYGDAGGRP